MYRSMYRAEETPAPPPIPKELEEAYKDAVAYIILRIPLLSLFIRRLAGVRDDNVPVVVDEKGNTYVSRTFLDLDFPERIATIVHEAFHGMWRHHTRFRHFLSVCPAPEQTCRTVFEIAADALIDWTLSNWDQSQRKVAMKVVDGPVTVSDIAEILSKPPEEIVKMATEEIALELLKLAQSVRKRTGQCPFQTPMSSPSGQSYGDTNGGMDGNQADTATRAPGAGDSHQQNDDSTAIAGPHPVSAQTASNARLTDRQAQRIAQQLQRLGTRVRRGGVGRIPETGYDENWKSLLPSDRGRPLAAEIAAGGAGAIEDLRRGLQVATMMLGGLPPGAGARALWAVIEELLAPRIDWRAILRNAFSTWASKRRRTQRRPNMKIAGIVKGWLPPGYTRHGYDVVAVIDTSGSMTGRPIQRALSEVNGLLRTHGVAKTVLYYVDDATGGTMTRVELRRLPDKWKYRGGGGTYISPAIEEALNSDVRHGTLLLIISDFYVFDDDRERIAAAARRALVKGATVVIISVGEKPPRVPGAFTVIVRD